MKILINNEEVLCDKNIKISEEMLNTSSTILNNVYPKTWETNHTYTNYYYPKDYSQCLIWGDKLRDASFNGYSSQNGTPTPTNPVPVESLTGETNVNIGASDNLFNKESVLIGKRLDSSSPPGEFNDSNYFLTDYIQVKPNTSYTGNSAFTNIYNRIAFYDSNMSFISINNGGGAYTITTPNNCYFMRFGKEVNQLDAFMLVEGNTAPGTYIPYTTKAYYLDLGNTELSSLNVVNLFNKGTVATGKRLDGANGNYYIDVGYFTSDFIKVMPGDTYIKNSPTADAYHRICFYTSDDYTTFISASNNNSITIPATANYIRFCGKETELNTTQFEKGNTVHAYTPYGKPLPIYKDRIYNVGENWYLHKEVGKQVLNGSETYAIRTDVNITGYTCFRCSSISYTILGNITVGASDYFTLSSTNVANTMRFIKSTGYTFTFVVSNSIASTVDEFKEWLSNNNVSVYYNMATPTTTQITDTNLINQLNVLIKDLLFSGVAKRTGNISLNPFHAHYCDLQVLDYKTLLSEGDTLDYVIADKTVEEAIDMVIESVKDYGFIKGNINIPDNFKMGTYNTQEKTAYDVFQYISDITQTKWTTRIINQDTVAIDFYNPYDKTPVGTIDSTKQYFKENNIIDISYNYSTEDYRNKQVMTSNEVVSSITQTFRVYADGVNKTFDIGQTIGDISYAYYTTSTDFVICDVITKAEQEQGYSGDIIYTPGETTFETDDKLANGVAITLEINLLVPGRQIALNEPEISRIATQNNRKGVISRYENRDDTKSSVELQRIAQSYIEYKGKAEITLTVQTQNVRLCEIGDIMIYNSSLPALNDNYMCKKIDTEMIMTTGDIFYTFEFSNTYNTENAINYFDNQRNKTLGNISDGETITRNLDIENQLDIVFFDTEVS